VHYQPFAVYLYHKREGTEPGSTYKNELYLFQRIAEILREDGVKKVTLNLVLKAV
jgi:hypothetical protein